MAVHSCGSLKRTYAPAKPEMFACPVTEARVTTRYAGEGNVTRVTVGHFARFRRVPREPFLKGLLWIKNASDYGRAVFEG